MSRRWLIVVDDPGSEIDSLEAADAYFRALIDNPACRVQVARVRRGGILADKVMEELPPVRHLHMGRPRG